ncbi:MAG: hypothetical protein ACXVRG_01745, partial [Gaiellaceae bacterium]
MIFGGIAGSVVVWPVSVPVDAVEDVDEVDAEVEPVELALEPAAALVELEPPPPLTAKPIATPAAARAAAIAATSTRFRGTRLRSGARGSWPAAARSRERSGFQIVASSSRSDSRARLGDNRVVLGEVPFDAFDPVRRAQAAGDQLQPRRERQQPAAEPLQALELLAHFLGERRVLGLALGAPVVGRAVEDALQALQVLLELSPRLRDHLGDAALLGRADRSARVVGRRAQRVEERG